MKHDIKLGTKMQAQRRRLQRHTAARVPHFEGFL